MEKAVIEEKINEIKDKIVREYKPEKIILFGSFAWGEPHEDSDVDLLVVMESNKPRIERQREVLGMIYSSDVPIDVLVHTPEELEESINKKGNLFLEDIVRNGKVLYVKPKSMFTIMLPHRPLVVLH